MLHKTYGARFHESYDTSLDEKVVYIGPHRLEENIEYSTNNNQFSASVGKLLLSPTRTFAPVIKTLLENHFDSIHGLIHCSGGGQTKCLKYAPDNIRIIKDNLFEPPVIFKLIQEASKSDNREMYQVFNMGTRLEVYTDEKNTDTIISVAASYGVQAQVIGRVEESEKKELILKTASGQIIF
jgi:phosphoribosylformylglycinamidine cyclo-ligase